MSRHHSMARRGSVWLGLTVTVAVIFVLLALLFPAVQSAREAARRMTCNCHVKQIGLALHNYATAFKVFPQGTICKLPPVGARNQ